MTYNVIFNIAKLEKIKDMIEKTETISNLCNYDEQASELLDQLYEAYNEVSDGLGAYLKMPHILN